MVAVDQPVLDTTAQESDMGNRQTHAQGCDALDVELEDDVGEGKQEVQHDDDADEDAPLPEGILSERGCTAQSTGFNVMEDPVSSGRRGGLCSSSVVLLKVVSPLQIPTFNRPARDSGDTRPQQIYPARCKWRHGLILWRDLHIRKMLRMMLPAGIHGMRGTLKPLGLYAYEDGADRISCNAHMTSSCHNAGCSNIITRLGQV